VLLALLGVALILTAFRVDVPMLSNGNPVTWHGWVHGIAFLSEIKPRPLEVRRKPSGLAYGGNPVAPPAHRPNASGPLPLCVD
jgi:hypothetical protein